jgi:hypothetical protein
MDFENLLSSLDIWKIDFNHSIKAARSREGRVKSVLSVGSSKDYDCLMA